MHVCRGCGYDAPALVVDTKHAETVCTACGQAGATDWVQDPNYAHVNGTLEKNDGPTVYQRSKHMHKWLGQLHLPPLALDDTPVRQKLELLFKRIEATFLLPEIRGKRVHFLSYPFVIKKMLHIVYGRHIPCHYKTMKSRARVLKHELMWDKIYETCGGFKTFTPAHYNNKDRE